MEAFDERSKAERDALKNGPVVDEDGFILVRFTFFASLYARPLWLQP